MDVGIVTPLLRDPGAVRNAVSEADGTPIECDLSAAESAEVDVVPATGDAAIRRAVEAAVSVPLLAIDASSGVCAIPKSALVDALGSVRTGATETIVHRAMTMDIDGMDTALAIRDIALVTEQPATISEFELVSGGTRIAEYRADGVVVATAAGSGGYARAVGGPILAPGTDALVAITIAPYRIDPDHWVLPPEEIRVTVTRDETAVDAVVDGSEWGPIEIGKPVRIAADRTFRSLRVPGATDPLRDRSGED